MICNREDSNGQLILILMKNILITINGYSNLLKLKLIFLKSYESNEYLTNKKYPDF